MVVVLNVLTYNVASHGSGVQWDLVDTCNVDDNGAHLHGLRADFISRYVLAECVQVAGKADDETSVVVPILCFQESVFRSIAGFELVGNPAVTHAGITTLFVPDAEWRAAHGDIFTVEAVSSAGPDPDESDDSGDDDDEAYFDFPIASLLVRTGDAPTYHRVVIASVHLVPFYENAGHRTGQLYRVAGALNQLVPKSDQDTPTTCIIAGDCNMQDREDFTERRFRDAFVAYERKHPRAAAGARYTWDTTTCYNGPPRRNFKARYDRVYVQTRNRAELIIKNFRLIGHRPYVNPVMDVVLKRFRDRDPTDASGQYQHDVL